MSSINEHSDTASDADRGRRQLMALVGLIGATVLLTCLAAPLIFNGLRWIATLSPALEEALDYPFERVLSRLALIFLVAGFIPALRWAGIRSAADFGFAPRADWLKEVIRGWQLGVLTIAILLLVAWGTGSFIWDPASPRRIGSRVLAYFVGAFLIGVIEEGFFRGGLFGAARKVWHWIPAMVVISLFFSFVHFLRPQAPETIESAAWYAGFSLLPHVLYQSASLWNYMPFALNLVLIGIILSILYHRQGHVYYIIGIHAGWVITLQVGRLLFTNDHDVLYWVYGVSSNVGRSWAATLMLSTLAILSACGCLDGPARTRQRGV